MAQSTFTVRLPNEAHSRLKVIAQQRQMSLNKLFEEMTTVLLTEFDTEARFRMRASLGSATDGLEQLNTLRSRHQKQGAIPAES